MYERVFSPVVILNYLKKKTYRDLPFELWDSKYLWLYEPTVQLLSVPVSGQSFDHISLYACEKNNVITGIAYVRRNDSNIHILLDTTSGEGLNELIQHLKVDNNCSIKITVKSREAADVVKKALGIDYIPGTANFFAKKCFVEPEHKIETVKPGDGYLFKSDYMPEGWPEVDMCLKEGIKYFTINEEGKSISSCGICYLTAFRAEMIAVGTRDSFRNKGYAKSVCSYAMKEALQYSSIVTWTADISNAASCATARSLGFIPYVELYHFEISNNQ